MALLHKKAKYKHVVIVSYVFESYFISSENKKKTFTDLDSLRKVLS